MGRGGAAGREGGGGGGGDDVHANATFVFSGARGKHNAAVNTNIRIVFLLLSRGP